MPGQACGLGLGLPDPSDKGTFAWHPRHFKSGCPPRVTCLRILLLLHTTALPSWTLISGEDGEMIPPEDSGDQILCLMRNRRLELWTTQGNFLSGPQFPLLENERIQSNSLQDTGRPLGLITTGGV